jgi:hypothetical protein
MKTKRILLTAMAMLATGLLFTSIQGCSKDVADETSTTTLSEDYKADVIEYAYIDPLACVPQSCIDSLPLEPLNQAEIDALTFLREEELLAHDVYEALSGLYTKPVFLNISKSELAHTTAIKALLVKYQLTDPAATHVSGTFQNPDLQNLYTLLASSGSTSLLDGLVVGATIEDLDISDLQKQLVLVDNQDITLVFNNLMKGSRNHLRSFYANILFNKGTYTPQYISQEEFDLIIGSSHEFGTGSCTCLN